jgi:hypothetical protein
MEQSQPSGVRLLLPGMRRMLLVASGLVFIVGVQLFILTNVTDRFFAWTINPALTAAFLGGAYWASCSLEFLAAREREWVRARIAVPAVLLFTTLTLIVTLVHIDRFHLGPSFAFETRVLTWVWIAVYALVPIVMAALLVPQLRAPGGDPPRLAPLPAWVRLALIVHAAIMAPLGVGLLLFPQAVAPLWPWMLTPLTARAIGAWLLSLGVAAAHASGENDWSRVRPAVGSYVILAVLQFIALARYPADVNWATASAWVYIVFLLSMLALGIYGVVALRQSGQRAAASAM